MAQARPQASTLFSSSLINYVCAIIFTLGCAILVVNAGLSIIPFIDPTSEPPAGLVYVEGALSLLSSTFFVAGGVFALIQIVNAQQERKTVTECTNHFGGKGYDGSFGKCLSHQAAQESEDLDEKKEDRTFTADVTSTGGQIPRGLPPSSDKAWVNYLCDLGLVGTTIFLTSSTIFLSASIASIITIAQNGDTAHWIRYPQLVAAAGFTVASLMMMLHLQTAWWRPAWGNLRWYVNLWNLVGSVGFIICAYFGLLENVSWARYHFGMSYLWGSSAFLLGAFMQWYKTLGKKVIDRFKVATQRNDAIC